MTLQRGVVFCCVVLYYRRASTYILFGMRNKKSKLSRNFCTIHGITAIILSQLQPISASVGLMKPGTRNVRGGQLCIFGD